MNENDYLKGIHRKIRFRKIRENAVGFAGALALCLVIFFFAPAVDGEFLFEELYDSVSYYEWEVIEDPTIGVKVQFGLENSGLRYELVAPFGVESPITNYLEKNGNMFHHIAYQVANFNMKCCELRKLGWVPLGEPKPAVAFSGKRVAFFLSPTRLIFELIEDSIQTNGNESQNE